MTNTPTFLDTLKEYASEQNLEVHEWRARNNQKYDALLREEHGQVVLDEAPAHAEVEVDADTDYREWWSQILTRKMRAEYVPVTEEADVPTNRALLPHGATLIETEGIIPVFVYGTLRYGQGNYYGVLAGHAQHIGTGAFIGAEMYSNGGFPYVLPVEDKEKVVQGDLFFLDHEDYVSTQDNLDMLEGTHGRLWNDHNHYNRSVQYIRVDEEENLFIQAWVYTAPSVDHDNIRARHQHVVSGDWNDRAQHPLVHGFND